MNADAFLVCFFWLCVALCGLFFVIGIGLLVTHEVTKESDDEEDGE